MRTFVIVTVLLATVVLWVHFLARLEEWLKEKDE